MKQAIEEMELEELEEELDNVAQLLVDHYSDPDIPSELLMKRFNLYTTIFHKAAEIIKSQMGES